jgi:hypothetical protein
MATIWLTSGPVKEFPSSNQLKKARGVRALFAKAGEEAKEFATILEKWNGPEWDKLTKARQGKKGPKEASSLGHKFSWIEGMGAWACEECGKTKRVAKQKTDREICKVKEMSQAGEARLKEGAGGYHMSHCVWKGWGEEGHPPTSVCVRCGCLSTFRCKNLKKLCKGSFVSEAARKRVGMGRHPTGGQFLKGWRRVGGGEAFSPLGRHLGHGPKHEGEQESPGELWDSSRPMVGLDRIDGLEESIIEGRQEGWEEEPTDWSLWMEGGQDEEEYVDGPVSSWGGVGWESREVPVGSSRLRA